MSEEFYDIMSNTSDRLRLKDKIVSNVAKAIKAIQQYSYSNGGEDGLVLSISDWQCHRLCENLDHALLHGLRHITNGYWRVVKEYTRKGTIKEIERYNRITTDLGRGRAWLYLCLNECLLESYIRCLLENEKQIKKFYVKEALLLDHQRLNVLLTLTSGLDFVSFQLDPNVPYLDLGTTPPRHPSSTDRRQSQDDRLSLHSMDSVSSRANGVETLVSTPDSTRLLTDSDNASMSSLDTTNGSSSTDKSRQCSLSLDSGCHLDNVGIKNRQRSTTPPTDTLSNSSQNDLESRLKRIESIPVSKDTEEITNDFEIIRVKSKITKSKSQKKKKTAKTLASQSVKLSNVPNLEENNNDDQTAVAIETDHSSLETSNKLLQTNSSPFELSSSPPNETSNLLKNDISVKSNMVESMNSIENLSLSTGNSSHDTFKTNDINIGDLNVKTISESQFMTNSFQSDVDDSTLFNDNLQSEDASMVCNNSPISTSPINAKQVFPSHSSEHDLKVPSDITLGDELSSNNKVIPSNSGENIEKHDKIPQAPDTNSPQSHSDTEVEENVYELYQSPAAEENSNMVSTTSQQRKNALEDYVKFISGDTTEGVDTTGFGELDQKQPEQTSCDINYCVNIDNNTMLYVMLEIFKDEDENFLKLMSCRQGHAEGDVSVVFVLITDRRIYLLSYSSSTKKFKVISSVSYQDIDFIVHSINYQIIDVVCTNKRNQFWLTTGDEVLSRLIVDTMCEAVSCSDRKIRELAVFDDATTQKICLKKYIIQECHCEPSEANAEIYSLVYWEDPHSHQMKAHSSSKEGKLSQKVKDPYKGLIWKQVYVVLRDGILCIFKNKSDSKPESYLRMGGEQCVGCRRSPTSDRLHTMEIILSKGDSWQLAAADNAELCDWLMCLCRAVSEGMQDDGIPFSCLPCCSVVTDNTIIMCHEDVQTSFFRTLGSANIEDITGITVDPDDTTYCLLEFDSADDAISSNEWVLYFNSTNEKNKFCTALSTCWTRQFQVELPTNMFDNINLQKRCQDTSQLLKNTLTL